MFQGAKFPLSFLPRAWTRFPENRPYPGTVDANVPTRKNASGDHPTDIVGSRCAILLSEQTRRGPSATGGDFQRMARRRYQKPTPKRRGSRWTILVREDVEQNGQRKRRVKRVPIGPTTRTKAEAERLRDDYLTKLNQPRVGIGGAILFRDFARIYERDVLSNHANTTQARSKSVLKNHLNPEFGNLMLREISLERLQAYFAALQRTDLSAESVDKVRDVMSAVLRTAVDYGRLAGNPAEKIRLKKRKLTKPKPFLRINQFNMLVEAIAGPYATMVYVAVFTGLRVSELAGLRWRNIHAGSITIEQRYCRGDWDEPKTRSSRATIPVSRQVIERTHRLKSIEVTVRAGCGLRRYQAVKSDGPADLVFQSVVTGAAMRDNNILARHIKPAARKLGIGWVNWQVLRRSFATWL